MGRPKVFRGGVAMLARKSVYRTFAGQESFWSVQSIGVWVAGTLVINCYSPPGHDPVTLFNLVVAGLFRTQALVGCG